MANFKEDLEFRPPTGQSVADNPLVQQNPVASVNPTELVSAEEEKKDDQMDGAPSQSVKAQSKSFR